MSKQFTDYNMLKNKWLEGSKVILAIDPYSEVLQINVDDNPVCLLLNEDELKEFIKSCEKAFQVLRGK